MAVQVFHDSQHHRFSADYGMEHRTRKCQRDGLFLGTGNSYQHNRIALLPEYHKLCGDLYRQRVVRAFLRGDI
jgi:hypothetical protein